MTARSRTHTWRMTAVSGLLPLLTGLCQADTIDSSGMSVQDACGYCHEYDGNSVMGNYPKLSGLAAPYLRKQLHDYRHGRRVGKDMGEATESLSDADIQSVSEFYSTQPRSAEMVDVSVEELNLGREIYLSGTAANPELACASCHATTVVSGALLQGQHYDYLVSQLRAFRQAQRRNDPGAVMRQAAHPLSDAQISAVSRYLSQQSPTRLR